MSFNFHLGHLKERCSSYENPTQLDTNTKNTKKGPIRINNEDLTYSDVGPQTRETPWQTKTQTVKKKTPTVNEDEKQGQFLLLAGEGGYNILWIRDPKLVRFIMTTK